MIGEIIEWITHLFHIHEWKVVKEGPIVIRDYYDGKIYNKGWYYSSRCIVCGKHKKEEV